MDLKGHTIINQYGDACSGRWDRIHANDKWTGEGNVSGVEVLFLDTTIGE